MATGEIADHPTVRQLFATLYDLTTDDNLTRNMLMLRDEGLILVAMSGRVVAAAWGRAAPVGLRFVIDSIETVDGVRAPLFTRGLIEHALRALARNPEVPPSTKPLVFAESPGKLYAEFYHGNERVSASLIQRVPSDEDILAHAASVGMRPDQLVIEPVFELFIDIVPLAATASRAE